MPSAFQRQVIDYFCDGVRLLGLPKSVGEIYGLLFITPEPLSLDDLVKRLEISKGSASQGLKMLRGLGAVVPVEGEKNERRVYFEPDAELKRLVGGFIKEQVRPHIKSGEEKLTKLEASIPEDSEHREFYEERIEKLERWSKKARFVLPILQKLLGK